MAKRTFTRDELLDVLYLYDEVGTVVLDEVTSTTRWSIHHRLVFKAKDDGKLYETSYSRAATELQSEKPWEYDDRVECTEVEQFERKVVDYRPVA